MYSMTGKLIVKNDVEQITDTFRKREFVITDENAQYPQEIMFQLTQDRVNEIEAYNINDEIKVNFNIRGRRWENPKTNEIKFFVSLDAWRIEKVAQETPPQLGGLPPMQTVEPLSNMSDFDDASDDLPF